jgi:PAS domain S-box-containing protein
VTSGSDPRAARELLDTLFEQTGVGLCLVAPDDTVVRANATWLRACRLPAEQVVGRDVLAPFPRWRRDARALQARARAGEQVDLPRLRRGGVTWDASVSPVRVADDTGLLFTIREPAGVRRVVRARTASPSRRRAGRGAPEPQPTIRALAEAMPQIVCSLAPDGTPAYVNPAWTAYSGLDLAASVAEGWLGVVHPDDVPALQDCWRRATESGASEQVELRYRAADGAYRWFLSRLAPIKDEGGRVVRWIGAGIEIDDRRRAEAERERLLTRLEEADRRKNDFLGVLSHELRNPLAPLRNAAYILEHAPAGGEQARVAVGVIGRQVNQLARLVDDLLDVTRIARGKIQLRRRRVDLGELVRRTAEDHRSLFAGRGLALTIEAPVGPLWVLADETRLGQVIGNLLVNAAKFTDAGGHVSVSVAEEGERAAVRVVDTGVGMPPAVLASLFEPFVQAEGASHPTRGGLGLGLALVKGLVELHGGAVEARSEGPGRGAELSVRLPVLRGADLEAPTPVPGPTYATRRVLVVEDNTDAAETLRLVLEFAGHEVEVARDGAQGVERTRELLPDVVLCDIGLPDRDGYDVAREIRATPELAGVRLVALTGHALPEDQRKAADAGFDAHLGKPVAPDTLERLLTELGPPGP